MNKEIIKKFRNLNVLVLGDVMIDTYLIGKVDRISPEAPVPIVSVSKKESRLGGAANVAMNLVALGAKPILCSVVGNDSEANNLIKLLKRNKISAAGIIKSNSRITTVKTRVISQSHQMLRVDSEITNPLDQADSKKLENSVKKLLRKADVLIFQDYDKGIITTKVIQTIIAEANKLKVPVAVDPKKRNFLNYKNAMLFKPNLKELKEGFKREIDINNKKEFEKVCSDLMNEMKLKNLFVTMSEHGVMITDGKKFEYIPAHFRKIADVSGAGDTVISVAALCLALGLPIKEIAMLSNLAGGLVCEEVGVVPINKNRLIEEAKNFD